MNATPDLPLRDIHLPPPVGWWPPAPGWWLAALAIIALSWGLLWVIRRMRRTGVRAAALRELEAIGNNTDLSPEERGRRLSMLIRRVALSLYPRRDVAGLTGSDWLSWLDGVQHGTSFSDGPGRLLGELAYRRDAASEQELAELIAACRTWLERQPRRRTTPGKAQ